MALLVDKPIPPEKSHFFDSLISGVPGSEIDYNSAGMIAPNNCDPRNPLMSNNVGCREVIAQFLSSNDNVPSAGRNVDISEATIPDSVIPEYSPIDTHGDRLNGSHLDQIIDLNLVTLMEVSL